MKYLVDSNNTIVGIAESMGGEPPLGFSVFEHDRLDLLGQTIKGGQPEVVPTTPTVEPVVLEPIAFWNSDLFKKARIKANKDPLLAMQVTIALSAEQRGDRKIYLGALKSIEDMLRKSDAKNKLS